MITRIEALLAAFLLGVGSLYAQQTASSKEGDGGKQENTTEARQQTAKQQEKRDSYRFRYTLAELNGKEKVNARAFEILTTSRGAINTKSHLPVTVGEYKPGGNNQFTYMDVGLDFNMDAWPLPQDEVLLKVDADMTTFVKPEDTVPPGGAEKNVFPGVITRRTTIRADAAVVKLGVPTVIGTADDVASSHSYQLSVTVTRR